jgi:SAM-dependent methyltransferase
MSEPVAMVEPYGPKLPLKELVGELNRIYHSIEASSYDASHPEIHDQLPPVWRALCDLALTRKTGPLRILNFGCGTGFEAEQVLSLLPRDRVAWFHCYDPVDEMLDRARTRISRRWPEVRFSSKLDAAEGPFDLLVTNAVLHHLADVPDTLAGLEGKLTADAVWLSGHEPSSRFYKNSECVTAYRQFLREDRWRKFLSPRRYTAKLANLLGLDEDPARKAAVIAHDRGLFTRLPPASVVSLLVDFHVAHSAEEAQSGRGFDLDELAPRLGDRWTLLWSKSYSFLGPYYEGKLPRRWTRVARRLAERFPSDGSHWSAGWQRLAPRQA